MHYNADRLKRSSVPRIELAPKRSRKKSDSNSHNRPHWRTDSFHKENLNPTKLLHTLQDIHSNLLNGNAPNSDILSKAKHLLSNSRIDNDTQRSTYALIEQLERLANTSQGIDKKTADVTQRITKIIESLKTTMNDKNTFLIIKKVSLPEGLHKIDSADQLASVLSNLNTEHLIGDNDFPLYMHVSKYKNKSVIKIIDNSNAEKLVEQLKAGLSSKLLKNMPNEFFFKNDHISFELIDSFDKHLKHTGAEYPTNTVTKDALLHLFHLAIENPEMAKEIAKHQPTKTSEIPQLLNTILPFSTDSGDSSRFNQDIESYFISENSITSTEAQSAIREIFERIGLNYEKNVAENKNTDSLKKLLLTFLQSLEVSSGNVKGAKAESTDLIQILNTIKKLLPDHINHTHDTTSAMLEHLTQKSVSVDGAKSDQAFKMLHLSNSLISYFEKNLFSDFLNQFGASARDRMSNTKIVSGKLNEFTDYFDRNLSQLQRLSQSDSENSALLNIKMHFNDFKNRAESMLNSSPHHLFDLVKTVEDLSKTVSKIDHLSTEVLTRSIFSEHFGKGKEASSINYSHLDQPDLNIVSAANKLKKEIFSLLKTITNGKTDETEKLIKAQLDLSLITEKSVSVHSRMHRMVSVAKSFLHDISSDSSPVEKLFFDNESSASSKTHDAAAKQSINRIRKSLVSLFSEINTTNINKQFLQASNEATHGFVTSSNEVGNRLETVEQSAKHLLQLLEQSSRSATGETKELLRRLSFLLSESGEGDSSNQEAQNSKSRDLTQALKFNTFLKETAHTLLSRLDSLQLLSHHISDGDNQNQILLLPMKIENEWTEVQMKFIKRKKKGGNDKESANISVQLNVSPSSLGGISALLNYPDRNTLSVQFSFERPETRKWFNSKEKEINTTLKELGFNFAKLSFKINSTGKDSQISTFEDTQDSDTTMDLKA
ncbi:hypothetical protein QA601_09140 [Chitinispirillales bacterium ANBcel5]|uniref:hypothetical protein n=1 Tax=Cellulosispirillum alkaliphilum TaxID=3039283 RepID=UPI002A545BFA|nr:hypothetical protein [Chitinispirillales bacterium ANBcel5]